MPLASRYRSDIIFAETGGQVSARRIDHERLPLRDPLPSDKLPVINYNIGGEKPLFHTRDRYSVASAPYSKDFASTSQFRGSGSSSSGMLRRDFLYSHRNDNGLLPSDELTRSSGKLTAPVGFDEYGKKLLVGTTKIPEGQRSKEWYRQHAYSPTGIEHEECFL
ncbi:XS domain protein [Quillaja saponaria]|uniref:XS domain protein n=1 Tax=Quillaja saponaria TaxID=32244 RepID=A0AAD7M5V1_QUISA|nr:XS domain protein [Quillaja saponaria]